MRTTITDLLALLGKDSAAHLTAGAGKELPVADVRVLCTPTPSAAGPDVLWVLPSPQVLAPPLLDKLFLDLYRQGAAGLVVPHGQADASTRLLAERLGLAIVAVPIAELDDVVRAWQRSLDAAKFQDLQRVADLKTALLHAWLTAPSLEDYLARAGDILSGRLSFADASADPPATGLARHHIEVPWGKGHGAKLAADLPEDLEPTALPDLFGHLASLIAMRIDRDVAAIESNIRLRGELLVELLVSESPGGSAIRAAERFGLDLGRKHFVALWDIDDFTSIALRSDMHEARILHLKRDIAERLEAGARQRFGRVWVLPHSDEFVLVAEAAGADGKPNAACAAMQELRKDLAQTLAAYGIPGISTGVGFAYAGSGGLRKSFEEAREALLVGVSRFGPDTITHFDDLGIHRFLYGWVSSPRSRDLALDFLRPLIEDDRHSTADLFRTLRTYLDARGKSQAAARLGIHRNTLSYRLGRVEKLLHVDLSDPSVQLVLQLLVRALPDADAVHEN